MCRNSSQQVDLEDSIRTQPLKSGITDTTPNRGFDGIFQIWLALKRTFTRPASSTAVKHAQNLLKLSPFASIRRKAALKVVPPYRVRQWVSDLLELAVDDAQKLLQQWVSCTLGTIITFLSGLCPIRALLPPIMKKWLD